MITQHPGPILEVTVDDPDSLQSELTSAVDTVRAYAIREGRHGIMMTQHGYASYKVFVSPEVPYGLTKEQPLWR
ncbi:MULTISPECIES: hypothetical protein [Micrococcaceae]|jgi:hypothetical protein|uniref:hypothetical protein n=1 Tax=Micrococcaceae TaxID=1268 RepID=UPI0020968898|nr:hypothetical protein [Arthrobacter sp. H16F315]MDD1475398.1 hypothetical protein [Arthrobacter sp. H16F315]